LIQTAEALLDDDHGGHLSVTATHPIEISSPCGSEPASSSAQAVGEELIEPQIELRKAANVGNEHGDVDDRQDRLPPARRTASEVAKRPGRPAR
jgi:hypothetical protein